MFGSTLRAQRLSNLSAEVTVNVINAPPLVKSAVFALKSNRYFSWWVSKGYTLLKRRKNLFKTLLVMHFVQHAQTKSVFTFQPTKVLVSSAKPALMSLIFLLRNKSWQYFFCGDGTQCLARKTSRDYEKKLAPFVKKFFHQPQSSTPEPVPKKAKIFRIRV